MSQRGADQAKETQAGTSAERRAALERTQLQSDDQLAQARALSSPEHPVLRSVPGYELRRYLGAGAYGEVWHAVEVNTGRLVAIKFFSHRGGLDWPLLTREVDKLAQLYADRHIVQLLQVGWDADPPYYVMEYLEGGSLADRLKKGPIPVVEAVRIFREVGEALVYVHGKAILHCDLKPANVLLDGRGRARLVDFGQARLGSEAGPALGTLFYMAPEQTDPHAIPDARWDVYALGALLYTMLTGRPPYASEEAARQLETSDTVSDRLHRYRELVAASPSPTAHRQVKGVDRALVSIIDRCLKRNAAERLTSAQDVLMALYVRSRQRARRPLFAFGIIGPLLLLLIMIGFGMYMWNRALGGAKTALTEQMLRGNLSAARLVAAAVDRNLEAVTGIVEKEASEFEGREALIKLVQTSAKAQENQLQEELQLLTDRLLKRYQLPPPRIVHSYVK